ncbi:protein of unknown function [Pseudodesulfovibrio profundus]|uniref:Uncharacterized protein n=1 Tax=Pseudodesulfovibrio profundus TaxID=57320 RepID=A0A2C8F4N5_9BACT|nr:protein of unknown function [Pseudodesulfovibrio profundus]
MIAPLSSDSNVKIKQHGGDKNKTY